MKPLAIYLTLNGYPTLFQASNTVLQFGNCSNKILHSICLKIVRRLILCRMLTRRLPVVELRLLYQSEKDETVYILLHSS